jgi:hypothetical protein
LHSYEEKKLTAKFFSIYLPVSAPNCPARNVVFNEKITEISAFWVEILVIFLLVREKMRTFASEFLYKHPVEGH